ncbi:uncharacterized protein [Hoplias malabaricus]|uniref:uncharacterized protein isoform X2 n=1 Tax=Hoplias malabaricus TaxID=27720 RepID=UPI0034635657
MLGSALILASVLTACLAAYSQISEAEVQIGGTVILPCNSSVFGRSELDVHWEAMGKDVAFFLNGQLKPGQGYEGRVWLQTSKAMEGDFSLTLTYAVMSDTDLYECLWQGKRSLSTVTLNVLPPPFPDTQTSVTEGQNVTLPCYGKIPKNRPWEKMFIQWLKDDEEVLLFSSGKIIPGPWHLALPPKEVISQGNFSLTVTSVKASDRGIYKCRYKTNDYEAPRSGVPEAYALTVLVSQELGVIATTAEEASIVTEIISSTTRTELFGFISDASHSTTAPNIIKVTSEVLTQPNTTTDFTGLFGDASADSTTAHVGVISEIPPQPNMTTGDLIGLIADTSSDSTAMAETEQVISEIPPQPIMTMDHIGLFAGASSDSTTVPDNVQVIPELLPRPSKSADFVELIADSSSDITTAQDAEGAPALDLFSSISDF